MIIFVLSLWSSELRSHFETHTHYSGGRIIVVNSTSWVRKGLISELPLTQS